MRVVLGLILSISFVFGFSMQDVQKYQEMMQNGEQSITVDKKTQVIDKAIKNDIDDNKTQVLDQQESIKNPFIYENNTKKKLQRYGAGFFKNKNKLDKLSIPTSNNYILNSGDTLLINRYKGKETKNYELKIDNNGNINIPNIGLLKVASLTLAEAKSVINQAIKKSFPTSKIIVDISQYSSIQVTITGNVKIPGIYNLSSFSSIKDALISANGILDIGSYRDISVIRDHKKVFTFDLYRLINNTTKITDTTLRAGDSIVVNFVKKLITLEGKVKYPAIYELKDDENFKDLLKYSGGFSYDATKDSIKLTRYEDSKLKTYILNKNTFFAMKPKDGDKIEVFNNLELKEKPYVYVHGKVVDKPTKYTFFDGMTISELYNMIPFKSEILEYEEEEELESKNKEEKETNNNQDKADKKLVQRIPLYADKNNIKIIRHNTDEKRVFLVSADDDFKLKAYDSVEFFNYFDTNPRLSIYIRGEVYKQGKIYIDPDTTFKDIVKLAGGFTNRAYKKNFELIRYSIENNERVRQINKIDFKDALLHDFILKDNDEITIYTIPNWYDTKEVTIKGEVRFPGTYTIRTGERLSSVIQRAGGFTDEAFVEGALFSRDQLKKNEEKRMKEVVAKLKQQVSFYAFNAKEVGAKENSSTDIVNVMSIIDQQLKDYKPLGRLVVHLEKDLKSFKNSPYDIRLHDKDTLIVPGYNDTVSVYGEVLNPSSFIYEDNISGYDYIAKAGGMTSKADDEHIYVVLPSGESKLIAQSYLFSGIDDKIQAGSTIVVPMKVNQVSNILFWKEVSQIVYQLAITAASLSTIGAL